MDAETITAILGLCSWAFEKLGPGGLLMLMAVAFSWRVYQDYRSDRETNALVAEKERTIQRLAADNRELRIALLKNLGKWSDEDIQRYILLNVPPDGPAARKLLEQSPSLPQAPSKTRRK